MDDYNEDFFDDDNEGNFRLERNAFERLGFEDVLGLGATINLKKSGYTDIDKFKLISAATINLINDINFDDEDFNGRDYTFSEVEIKSILDMVEKIPDFKYKNPPAFVLGYIPVFIRFGADQQKINVVRDQRSIDKNVLKDTFKIYEKIEAELTTKLDHVDIVRYARCLTLK